MGRGKLYVFEGPDGVGKSTLAHALVDHLRSTGRTCHAFAFPGREPGTLGRHVWELHHAPDRFGVERIDPTSLQVLHVAAHIDTIEQRIRPAVARGDTIVLDRFWWSTLAYGTQFGALRDSLEAMIALELGHWGGIEPDVIFLVYRDHPLRPESHTDDFDRLNELYVSLASESETARIIDNSGPLQAALDQLVAVFEELETNAG